MQRFALVVVVVAAGCVEPSLLPCGDLYCSLDDVCVSNPAAIGDEPATLCARQDQLDACDGLADGDTCSGGYCSVGICTPNKCGDDRVTGSEACEGADVRVSCGDLGFYRGETSCTDGCSIDSNACEGRCGDSIIDADQGEICDLSKPTESCVDNGRDWGDLGCGKFCLPAVVNDCHRYGITTLLSQDEGIISANANVHGVAALTATKIRVVWDGVEYDHPRAPDAKRVFANSTKLVVYGDTTVSWFDGSAWHDMNHTLPGTESFIPNNADLTEDDWIYAMGFGCDFHRLSLATGLVEDLPGAPDANCSTVAAFDEHEIYANGGSLYYFDGAAWSTVSGADGSSSSFLQRGAAGHVFSGDSITDYTVDHGTLVAKRVIGGVLGAPVAFDDNGQYVYDTHGDDTPPRGISEGPWGDALARAPNLFFADAARDATGALIVWDSGVLRYDAQILAARPLPSAATTLALLPDGALTYSGSSTLGVFGPSAFTSSSSPYSSTVQGGLVDIAGDPRYEHFLGTNGTTTRGLWRYDTTSGAYQHESTGVVSQLALTPAGTLYIRANSSLLRRDGATLTPLSLPTGCAIVSDIAATSDGIAMICSNAVYRYDTQWTQLGSGSSLTNLRVAPDDSIFVLTGTNFVGPNPQAHIQRADAGGLHDMGLITTNTSYRAVGANELFIRHTPQSLLHYIDGSTTEVVAPDGAFVVNRTHIMIRALTGQLVVITRVPTQTHGLL